MFLEKLIRALVLQKVMCILLLSPAEVSEEYLNA